MVEEPTQSVVQQLPQDKQSLLRHLEKTNPEALALANDWEDVAYSLMKSKGKIEKCVDLAVRSRIPVSSAIQTRSRRPRLSEPEYDASALPYVSYKQHDRAWH